MVQPCSTERAVAKSNSYPLPIGRNKKAHRSFDQWALKEPGNVLLSHSLAAAVSSALEDFTSVFGMGTGVAPPAWSPGIRS